LTLNPILVSEAKRTIAKVVPDDQRASTFVVILHERSGDMGEGALDKHFCPAAGFYKNVFKHYRDKVKDKKLKFVVVAQNPEVAAQHEFFKSNPDLVVLPQAPLKNGVKDEAHHWPNMIRDEPLDLAVMQQGDAMVSSSAWVHVQQQQQRKVAHRSVTAAATSHIRI
jgi:hypothetical protein